jgi:hypothetical protein
MTLTAWSAVLAAPAAGDHIAQLYTDPGFLARAVSCFAGDGLRRGDAVVLVTTPAHRDAVARHLERDGFAVPDRQRQGQLTVLDAAETLSAILVDGMPDATRFHAVIGGVIDAANAAGHGTARGFGEMVDILRHRSLPATLRLEALWGELLVTRKLSLLCGYSLDNFDRRVHRGILQRVSALHSHLIPVEDYARLEDAVEQAFADVFGAGGDAPGLRRLFLATFDRPAAMPDAEALILAARHLAPTTADVLVDRVRHHYLREGVPDVAPFATPR